MENLHFSALGFVVLSEKKRLHIRMLILDVDMLEGGINYC